MVGSTVAWLQEESVLLRVSTYLPNPTYELGYPKAMTTQVRLCYSLRLKDHTCRLHLHKAR